LKERTSNDNFCQNCGGSVHHNSINLKANSNIHINHVISHAENFCLGTTPNNCFFLIKTEFINKSTARVFQSVTTPYI